MKHIWIAMTALAIGTAAPAIADVKTGVDAWQQGDYAKAIGEWRPLAQAGDPDAQFNMGQAYKLGRGVPADVTSAIGWYRKAAAQGHLRAEDNLGLLLFQQGDRAGAMPFLQKAAMRGEPRAQYIVGTALFNGDIIGKDWVRAYALMTRASQSGLGQATTSLQQMDKYVPDDQKRQGVALATTLEQTERRNAALAENGTATAPVKPIPARPAPAPIRTAEVPHSTTDAPTTAKPKPAPQQVAQAKPAPEKPAVEKPAPVKVAARPAIAPANGNWRVQLGAFSEEGRARSLWSQLSGKVKGLSAYKPYVEKSGAVTRLQAGPLASSADASRLCSAIKASGADCMPKKI